MACIFGEVVIFYVMIMKKYRPYCFFAMAAGCCVVLFSSGCGDSDSGKVSPPLIKIDLSLRMLENSRSGDYQTALSQCRKLRELGTPSMGFKFLELNVNYNSVMDSAQKELDKGDAGKALQILNAARSRFGSNQVFLGYIAEVEFLAGVKEHIAMLHDAATLEEKRAALTVLEKDCNKNSDVMNVLADELAAVRADIAAEEERIRLEKAAAEAKALLAEQNNKGVAGE